MALPFKVKKFFQPKTSVINRTIIQNGGGGGGSGDLLSTNNLDDLDDIPTALTNLGKDSTGGFAGLTLFKINFKNALNTITSFFTNANTVARTYLFQDRDGTIADDTDITSAKARGNHTGTQTASTVSDFNAAALTAAPAETGGTVATLLHASTNKGSLVDADEINGTDSANSFSLIRSTWTQVKAFLKTYFDTLYASLAGATFTGTVVVPIVRNSSVTLNTGGGAQTIIAGTGGGVYLFVAYDTSNDSTVSIAYGVGAGSTITELADSASVYTWSVSGSNFQVAAGGRTVQVTVLRLN